MNNFDALARRVRCLFFWILAFSMTLTLGACGRTTLIVPSSTPIAQTPRVQTLTEQAAAAFKAGQMGEAERLYGIIVRSTTASPQERAGAWEPLSLAALANKHPYSALDTLAQWQADQPNANTLDTWQRAWVKALAAVPPQEAERRATQARQSANVSVRTLATAFLWNKSALAPQEPVAIQLTNDYSAADNTQRQRMERALFNGLSAHTDAALAGLTSMTGPERDHVFPWPVVLLEALQREQAKNSPQATAILERVNYPSLFADVTLLTALTGKALPEGTRGMGATGVLPALNDGCFALALPMSGSYSPIGWKISRGASAAQAELAKAGHKVELTVINTDQADWIDKLAALPPQCVTVGGPLQPEIYATAKERGLVSSRAFFTFLSQLDGQDEGTVAWRFFSSPQDQVSAVLRFAQALGLNTYGVLAPEEPYGQRMTELFLAQVGERSESVNVATYNPTETSGWTKIVGDFVGVQMINKVPVPSTRIQALFVPDAWNNAEVLVPYLFFQGEDRMLLMGTALWEQGLAKTPQASLRTMELAIFPAAWNGVSPSAKASELIDAMTEAKQDAPDLWVAMGYDFVRFGATLALKPGEAISTTVNDRLIQTQRMAWSMAPIQWTQGKASQQLFLFTPTEQGLELANTESFTTRLEKARARHDRRVQAVRKSSAQ